MNSKDKAAPRARWRTTASANGEAVSTIDPKKVLPHFKEVPVTDDMTEGTRAFAEQYNAMRATLIEHKLMKAK